MYVWVEWICRRCGGLHRARFKVIVGSKQPPILRDIWMQDEIVIEDVALRSKIRRTVKKGTIGSRIRVQNYTQIQKILRVLSKYMHLYYSIQPDTLKMEVCYDNNS